VTHYTSIVNVDGFTLGKITDWEAESCETGDALRDSDAESYLRFTS
jgi:hypothetical protein